MLGAEVVEVGERRGVIEDASFEDGTLYYGD